MLRKNDFTIENNLFIKNTINHLETQLDKYLISNRDIDAPTFLLKQKIKTFKEKIEKQEETKKEKEKKGKNYKPIFSYLPQIKKALNPNNIEDPKDFYQIKKQSINSRYLTETGEENSSPIRSLSSIMRQKLQNLKLHNETHLHLNEIESSIQINNNSVNLSDRNIYLKYSLSKRMKKKYNDIILDDDSFFPIIRKKELKSGIYNMINRGLIPKGRDISPAFEYDGNPFTIMKNKSVINNYKKITKRDDILIDNRSFSFKYTQSEIKEKLPIIIQKDNAFLTQLNHNNLCSIGTETTFAYNNNKQKQIEVKEKEEKNKEEILLIEFNNFIPVQNDNLVTLLSKCIGKENIVMFIIDKMCILLRKFHLNHIHCEIRKIVDLALKKDYHKICNEDLLLCIKEDERIKFGLEPSNKKEFVLSVKNAFAITIQKFARYLIAKNKLRRLMIEKAASIYIQTSYRNFVFMRRFKNQLNHIREQRENVYMKKMQILKENWSEISQNKRIEIHLNTICNSNDKILSIGKFKEKENLQLNRLIRLIDQNVSIIYIISNEISDKILEYYFSILNEMGVKNAKERFHIIITEYAYKLPPRYSLSQLLLMSNIAQMEIREIIKDKNCYIVPGVEYKLEEEIGFILECPVLMGRSNQMEDIFNKSSCKRIFEINNIEFPISAWDIKSEKEFYLSLTHLISNYPNINIWIFKCNKEIKGRGIAYINLNEIEFVKMIINDSILTNEINKEKLYNILYSVVRKYAHFAYPNLYKSFNEYLKEFIKDKGIIESCPTYKLNGIEASIGLPLLIEPNGNINILPSYDKINISYFKNILCTSPQRTLIEKEINTIGEKIGIYLYNQNIIGYITIEFIVFYQGTKRIFLGIDLKFGLTDEISSLQFCYFLYKQSVITQIAEGDLANNKEKINKDALAFTIPYISHSGIREILFREFLQVYRSECIVFEKNKKEGVIFNFPDELEGGLFGICGVINLNNGERMRGYSRLWEMIRRSMKIAVDMIKKNKGDNKINSNGESIQLQEMCSMIKMCWKYNCKDIEKERKQLKSIIQFS